MTMTMTSTMTPTVLPSRLVLAGFALLLAVALPGVARSAHADQGASPSPDGHAYAIVVGSNPGGQGQERLRYAERDAARVAGLLHELSGYERDHVHLLEHPTPEQLLRTIERVAAALAEDRARGIESRFFFYYSGHARAHALNLGAHEVPLEVLRDKLLSLESALTVVVLDACQSGAFSRIKGAEPSADFSFNSVSRLNARGVAVMASSSASELSQESERLGSSYFTHHLLVALRGAGDGNRDGRVSLDEAYEYAYQRTLVSTTATAVGSQHVTLETDLRGKGDVALSYPARSDSQLEVPATLEADILVHVRPGGAVVAELHKSRGAPVRLALPHGAYRVLLRAAGSVRRCDLTLDENRATPLDPGRCVDVPVEVGASKGGPALLSVDRMGLELSSGFTNDIDDRYVARLEDFGFSDQILIDGHLRLALTYQLRRDIDVVLDINELDTGRFRRDNDPPHEFTWTTHGAAASLRYTWIAPVRWLRLFAQAGAGLARGRTTYNDMALPSTDDDVFWGYQLSAAAGVQIMPWRRFGVFLRSSYEYAPVLENLLGDVHDSGGHNTAVGIRARF